MKWAVAALLAALLAGLAAWAVPAWQARALRDAGAELFDGRRAVAARIGGHDDGLPAQATRCANCHLTGAPPVAAASAPSNFGPVLSAATLTQARPRRGGPPSRYDAAALCRLLRDGTDPAWVLLPRAMPRYDITDEQCRALWAHLVAA